MKRRGRVIQEAVNGTGLISSSGKQYEFEIAGMWKSDVAPKADMVVEIELDSDEKISAVSVVSESDLAKEQAEKAMHAAKEKGVALYSELSSQLGKPALAALAALVVAWFFLDVITIKLTPENALGISFWQMLGLVNNGLTLSPQMGLNADKGIYGFLAVIALAGPVISRFWKDPKAYLGYILPLALMLAVGLKIYAGVHDTIEQSQAQLNALGGNPFGGLAGEMMSKMMKQALQAIHIGIGGYVAVVASTFLAFVGMKKFLAAKA